VTARVLVVDDDPVLRRLLEVTLARAGFEVASEATGAGAWRRFQEEHPELVVLDLQLGDASGLDLLPRMREDAPETKVVVITASGSIATAVAAMRLGAYDFLRKPIEPPELVATLENAARTAALERRVDYLAKKDGNGGSVVASPAMRALLEDVRTIASRPVPTTLVLGESGAGKQLVARMLHDASERRDGPFVELNASAIPEHLVESELFGHERGAFSDARDRKLGLVEVADGGSLFLDEIGDLAPAAQAKLLTFVEQRAFRRLGATAPRTVDVRLIAATHRDLAAMVAAGRFRADLWYRLSAVVLRVPPLRERVEDLAPLAEHFLAEASREYRRHWRGLSPDALAILRGYPWPGNVRELRAVIARIALLGDGDLVEAQHLPADLRGTTHAPPPRAPLPRTIQTLAEAERSHIEQVLAHTGGNRSEAARLLGITRQTLRRKLAEPD
jgi:two-component system response regulator AtoC